MYVAPDLRTVSITLCGESHAKAISAVLVSSSQWFSVLPLPDDRWEITMKEENKVQLKMWCSSLGLKSVSDDC